MNTTIYVSIFLWLEIRIIEYFQFFVITRRKTIPLSSASFRACEYTLLLGEFLRARLLQRKTYVCSTLTDVDSQFSKPAVGLYSVRDELELLFTLYALQSTKQLSDIVTVLFLV